jgi:hypothetical protein
MSMLDDARPRRPATATGEENITGRVEELIKWDRHVTVDNVTTEVGIGHASAHKLIHDIQQYCKVSSWWVPRQLTPDHKAQRMGTSLQHLLHYETEENAFLFQSVTGDKSWVHISPPSPTQPPWHGSIRHPPPEKSSRQPPQQASAFDCVLGCLRGSFVEFFGARKGDEETGDPSMPNATVRH